MAFHAKIAMLLVGVLLMVSGSANAEPIYIQSGIKQIILDVEIAATPEQRAHGLMGRTDLAENGGMLFLFPRLSLPSFWMKDTLIPLDMIFFDEQGIVVCVHEQAKPLDLTPVTCPVDVLMVLEIGSGEAKKHGIVEGSVLLEKSLIKSLEVR